MEEVQASIPKNVSYIYIRQIETLGLGHAVLTARPVVGDNPFAVILADDLIDGQPGAMSQMIQTYNQRECSLVAVQDIPREETGSYGIVETKDSAQGNKKILNIIEKPHPHDAPSTLAAVGRYVLHPGIFDCLEGVQEGAGGEIQLTDAIAKLIETQPVHAFEFSGTRYDCGSKLGFLEASVAYGLKREGIGPQFHSYLRKMTK